MLLIKVLKIVTLGKAVCDKIEPELSPGKLSLTAAAPDKNIDNFKILRIGYLGKNILDFIV